MRIAGKIAVVIGGAQGMGQAFCQALLENGAKVLVSDILADEGEKTTRELQEKFGEDKVVFLECNVTNQQQIKALFDKCVTYFGGHADILVNVAGIVDEFNWKRCIDVNIGGTIQACEEGIKVMSKEAGGKGGVVILLASISGLRPEPWGPVYSASKHAIIGYCRSMGLQKCVDVTGVRFNCICPTTVDTPFLGTATQGMKFADEVEEYLKQVDRIPPSYVAEGLVELIEDDSLTGQALRVTKAKGRDIVQFEEHPLQ